MNPISPSTKTLFDSILYKNSICTLATASLDGKPEAATIQYIADEKYNLFFESFPTYRKYKNFASNPRVSVVITNPEMKTVQMDGTVSELSGDDAERAKQKIIDEHGKGVGYLFAPNVLFFRFTPSWIRVLVDGNYPPTYEMVMG